MLTATGHQHKTQRKILNPVFTSTHMRDLAEVSQKLNELIELKIQAQGGNTAVLDIYKWLSFAALEAAGQAGFGHCFSALEPDSEDVDYLNASHSITALLLKLWYITPVLPWLMRIGSARFRRTIVDYIPFGPIRQLRNAVDILNGMAENIYHTKKKELDKVTLGLSAHPSRDIMTSLLLQNKLVAPEDAMSEEEVVSQVNALIFAAHDTTSTVLARTIHILSEHPDVQYKLRSEIREAHEKYSEELGYDRLTSLPYLDAVCRESLRLYAPGLFIVRVAQEDWTIPLLYPVKSYTSQETITHIPIKKGSHVYLSLDGANRDVRTWGEDSNVFRPSRWLDPAPSNLRESRMPGIYSSLMTFSGGPRACIGFKFAQLEMKLLLAKLVSSFKFETSGIHITWRLDSVPKPYVGSDNDEMDLMPSMPVRVTPL
ncbi:hypothetical protein OPQ81_002363 [Rhizoctonia solani]|nr:hypothetical protein OPQ81_002363 [Rhizoctonia solani]